jgi:hypothetical protein
MTTGDTTLLEPAPYDYDGEDYGEWRECRSEQMWRGPRIEVVWRSALAVFVLAVYLLGLWAHVHQPRYVDDYRALLRDANAGRVVRVAPYRSDDTSHLRDRQQTMRAWRDGLVRWQTREGRYEAPLPERYGEVEAVVRAQPYVAAHPGSVTFAPLAKPPTIPRELVSSLGFLVALTLISAPQPRLLTKWGWFWAVVNGVGLIPYLIFGGSTRRATPSPSGRRLNGWVVVLAPMAIGMLLVTSAAAGMPSPDLPSLRGVLNPAPVTTGDFREPPVQR